MATPDERPAAAQKAALRRRLTAARRARSAEDLATARAAIAAAVHRRHAATGWECVAAYVPLRTEPGSVELLEGLVRAGARVLVPVLLADRDLDWQQWPDGPPLGRGAVRRAQALLVPALAAAPDGTRLGRGGGSYDRVLNRVDAGTPVAALLFAEEVLERLPREPWDRPVTAAATPAGWRDLGPAG